MIQVQCFCFLLLIHIYTTKRLSRTKDVTIHRARSTMTMTYDDDHNSPCIIVHPAMH